MEVNKGDENFGVKKRLEITYRVNLLFLDVDDTLSKTANGRLTIYTYICTCVRYVHIFTHMQ